ncbi:hypothetical protein CFA71_24560 [Mycobacteroides abscessus subsp. bolletii]|nr:hypothetical protein CFA71_24560 [Mycobacteroides abscessus subsp. bolletii]
MNTTSNSNKEDGEMTVCEEFVKTGEEYLEQHLKLLAVDYTFPLSPSDALSLYHFLVDMLHSNPRSGHFLAHLLTAATVRLASDHVGDPKQGSSGSGASEHRATTPDEAPKSGPGCLCCRNLGVLPESTVNGQPVGIPGMIDGDAILQCCEACMGALAFGGTHPHELDPSISLGR